jgi:starch synthase (maltosyl-transferring)
MRQDQEQDRDFERVGTQEGRQRVIIEGVAPEIDGGRFAAKRALGENACIEADIFTDGHDSVSAVLLYRKQDEPDWTEVSFTSLGNDRWRASFPVTQLGVYVYTLEAWVDPFMSWRKGMAKKIEAGQDVAVDLLIGTVLVEKAVERARAGDKKRLRDFAALLKRQSTKSTGAALDDDLVSLMERYPDRQFATRYDKELEITVDRERARFSSWYELFPRSCGENGRHGTFKDVERRLPYVASMGFDVLYLPPIHPVGRTFRKGKNNAVTAEPRDVGSPWAIGSVEGGHKSVHPDLGTFEDFEHLVQRAKDHGLEIALDIAFQCTPDHPYVTAHPEWFRHRPDGSIQYAENPPKKYQDIYPIDFETEGWRELWDELRSVFTFWIGHGVRIFRVDNPHTKAFPFWEDCISRVKEQYPDTIFLAEAFTRPRVMGHLAKLGFSQSYTYFSWRNTKWELTEYFTDLTKTEMREYFRSNLWPNTPDILPEYLQYGGRPAFITRLVLAATLGASYGVYGPAFELCENQPREPRSEEYLNSEKYEIRQWDLDRPDSLKGFIARVNRIRKENVALQSDRSLRFHRVDNDQIISYSKQSEDRENTILTVVNLDPHHLHSGWVDVDLEALGLDTEQPYQVHDLLTDAHYLWQGARNYVELNPQVVPTHIFRVRHRTHREQDFDYFM